MRACLVTGGSGFIGRCVVRRLADEGHEVVVLGRRPLPDRPTIVADLARDRVDLRTHAFDEVYHVAGLAHRDPRTRADAERFMSVNVEGTRRLLEALRECREPPRSLLFVSSVAVYGVRTGENLDESTPRRAGDPYGLSKRRAEDLVLEWGERHEVRTAILRLPLVAGPGAPGNLGRMAAAIRAGWYVGVAAGAARRSIVRLADVVEALPGASARGGVFHLTDGHHPSFAELEAAMAGVLRRRSPRRLPATVAAALARLGDGLGLVTGAAMPFDGRTLARMTSTLTFSDERARNEIGWRPARVVDHAEELSDEGRPLHSK